MSELDSCACCVCGARWTDDPTALRVLLVSRDSATLDQSRRSFCSRCAPFFGESSGGAGTWVA